MTSPVQALHEPQVAALGDEAVLVRLGTTVDAATASRVRDLVRRLEEAALPGVREVVPAYASVALYLEDSSYQHAAMDAARFLAGAPSRALPDETASVTTHVIPVRYDGADLAAAARERSPCVAVIAPAMATAPPPAQWLMAIQRLYRCWREGQPGLEEASASLAPARMEAASMPVELHARLVSDLLAATRPGERAASGGPAALLSALGAEARGATSWAALPRRLQRHWRSLFMADLYPDNLSRLDFDMKTAAWRILLARGLA